jgi:cobalamin biosynthesis protein CobT
MCLAEQLAETYKKAKTDLVESLSFTLMDVTNCTKLIPDRSEHPILSGHHIDPELKLHMIGNLNTHNYFGKPSVETMLTSFVDTPPGSTNDNEVFIPDDAEVVLVEDQDIHAAEDILASKRLPAASMDSVIEGDCLGIIYSSSDSSDDLDNRSDEVHDGDGNDDDDDDDEEEEEEEEEDEDEDGEQQEKNHMAHVENTAKNHEKDNVNEKEETARKRIEEELAKGLNPDANEFKPLDVVVPVHGEVKSHSRGNVEAKTAAKSFPAPFDNIHLIGAASGKSYTV